MPAPKDPKKYALWKKRLGIAQKKRFLIKENHPSFGKKPWNIGLTKETDERVRRYSEAREGQSCSEKTRRKMRKTHKNRLKDKTNHPMFGKKQTLASRKKGSKTQKERLKDPRNHPFFGKHLAESHKQNIGKSREGQHYPKLSEARKRDWENPEYRKEHTKYLVQAHVANASIQPNKPELRLFSIIQKHFPGDYAINVKAEVMLLGGKIPDFVNVNGAKSCIELFGDYWHKGQDPQDRINYFKQFGYNTLVIWEHELNNEDLLVQRLTRFKYVRRKKSHC